MLLDIIADAICPWCFVGQRNLSLALRRRPIRDLTIRYRPFLLDPSVPPEGIESKTYYTSRIGSVDRLAQARNNAIALGQKVDIHFAFERIKRVPNTLDAHRIIRWAGAGVAAQRMSEGLYCAYFEDGVDIGDRDALIEIAAHAGLDTTKMAQRLTTSEDVSAVLEEDRAVRALGINGVPCLLVDQKYALMGAQDPINLASMLERIETHTAG